jgi:cyclopropane fatty-acyl-phospholipid synthase-like methyltransferase
MASASDASRLADFTKFYGRKPSEAELAVEREVFGINAGIISYTTPAQADQLAEALELRPGMLVLEIGAGSGWPGVRLVKGAGCEGVLTDVPRSAVRGCARRAFIEGVSARVSAAVADGARLPFRPKAFNAVVHSDVL